jgi:hypothetical protein
MFHLRRILGRFAQIGQPRRGNGVFHRRKSQYGGTIRDWRLSAEANLREICGGDEMDAELEQLRASIAELEQRVARLEGRTAVAAPVETVEPAATESHAVALMGRSLIVLGGAYLLRAATDLGWLPPWLGALTALIYAGILLALADRDQRAWSALFHGGTALAIAIPLIDEMLLRLHLVNAWSASAIVALYCGGITWVSGRRRHTALAWLGVVGGTSAWAALAIQSRELAPCLAGLTLLGGCAALLARRLEQRALLALPLTAGGLLAPWLAELALNGEADPVAALAMLLIFFVVSVIAIWCSAATSHVEMVEAGLLLPLLIESARLAPGHIWFGATLLACAAAAFALARESRFFRSYWLLVGLIALSTISGGATLALLCLALTAALLLSGGDDFQVLAPLGAAALASGLAGFVVRALLLPELIPPSLAALLVVAALVAVAAARPRAWALLGACLALAGLLSWAGIALGSPSEAARATIRTGVLAAMVMALALVSRLPRATAAGRLVFPLLALTGLKLLIEDFRVGTSAALFIDLALSGTVLILAPRLRAPARNR